MTPVYRWQRHRRPRLPKEVLRAPLRSTSLVLVGPADWQHVVRVYTGPTLIPGLFLCVRRNCAVFVFLDYFPLLCDGSHKTPPARVTCQKIVSVWMLIVSTYDTYSIFIRIFSNLSLKIVLFLFWDKVYKTAEYFENQSNFKKIRDPINKC